MPSGGFPRVPILRRVSADVHRASTDSVPKDEKRILFADVLVQLALEFLVFHEIGHILGGHLETISGKDRSSEISELAQIGGYESLRKVLECDADAFAAYVMSWTLAGKNVAEEILRVFETSIWQPYEFAVLTLLTSIGGLFRLLYPSAPAEIDERNTFHPHPAVRACLVASSIMARDVHQGKLTERTLEELAAESIGNLEHVWADLCLPGQHPEPTAAWAEKVGEEAMKLFNSYGDGKSLLDQDARIPRRWDNWQWPEKKKPT
jgi:hypothetical protein